MKCSSGRTTGTCIPTCPWYGTCHCGCGGMATVAHQNDREDGRRRGHPGMWLPGHSPATLAALNRAGYAGDRDIPVAEVMWMLNALLDHHGSVYRVAKESGVNHATLHRLLQGQYERVRRITQERIERAYRRVFPALRLVCDIPWCDRTRYRPRLCETHRGREERYGHPLLLPLSKAHVPVEPLREWLDVRAKTIHATFGYSYAAERAAYRALNRPLSVAMADNLACKYLGVNPREIWPDWDSYGWEEPPEGWVEAS